MDREVLLERFRGTTALRDAGQWYGQARHLLEELEFHLLKKKIQNNGSKQVLWLLILRIRRYLLALSFMSIQTCAGNHFCAVLERLCLCFSEEQLCLRLN